MDKRGRPKTYKARNIFYLRISKRTVLLSTLLTDQKHANWLNRTIFQRILEVLKPRLSQKLKSESQQHDQKKTKLDFYRGDGFQMGFFFRRDTPRHAVLLKTKELLIHHRTKTGPEKLEQEHQNHQEIQFIKPEPDDDQPIYIPPASPNEDSGPLTINDDNGEEGKDQEDKLDIKPELKVSYTGFSIFGRTLVVVSVVILLDVVEPFPALSTYKLSLYQQNQSDTNRELSVVPTTDATLPAAATSSSSDNGPLFRCESPTLGEDFLSRTQAILDNGRQESNENEDDDLPEFAFSFPSDLTNSGGHGGLLSDLIKNPNSDRQKDSKQSGQNLTLDQYLVKSRK